MNIALMLSGGSGTRFGSDIPKQYQIIEGKPAIIYTMETAQQCELIDKIIAVANFQWKEHFFQWKRTFALTKLVAVAPAGNNRQTSIKNGLLAAEAFVNRGEETGVIVQDAARPLTSGNLLMQLIQALKEAPCVMPVLPLTDTTYMSQDGQWVDGLLDRSILYAGQAPEAFHFWPYLQLYRDTPDEILNTMSGSCQLPYHSGWKVKMIPGEKENIKLTYASDLAICEKILQQRGRGV